MRPITYRDALDLRPRQRPSIPTMLEESQSQRHTQGLWRQGRQGVGGEIGVYHTGAGE